MMQVDRREKYHQMRTLLNEKQWRQYLALEAKERGSVSHHRWAWVHSSYRGCIGEARGTVAPAKSAIIKVEGMTLPQGTYRLDAHLILTSATGSSEASPGPSILKKSQILHIN
jgi:hypothetical protein